VVRLRRIDACQRLSTVFDGDGEERSPVGRVECLVWLELTLHWARSLPAKGRTIDMRASAAHRVRAASHCTAYNGCSTIYVSLYGLEYLPARLAEESSG
jgi:hypothetical protein